MWCFACLRGCGVLRERDVFLLGFRINWGVCMGDAHPAYALCAFDTTSPPAHKFANIAVTAHRSVRKYFIEIKCPSGIARKASARKDA